MTERLQRALIGVAVVNLAVVAWDVASGGIYFTVFGRVVSSWEVMKPIRYAAACAAVAIWLQDRTGATTSWDLICRWAGRAARAIVIVSIVMAGWFGIRAAGGADAFGYISQAELWVERQLGARQ